MEHFLINVDELDAGSRIDRYMAQEREELSDLSRSYLQKLIQDGNVLVNGCNIKANYKLKKADIIDITLPDIKEPQIEAENIPLDILYEDEDIIVINKPKIFG